MGGCESATPGSRPPVRRAGGDFASAQLLDIDLDAVRPVATAALQKHFRIDPAASSSDAWVSRPREVTDQARPERLRDVLRGPANQRREVAELQLAQEGSHVLVLCRVQIQRLDLAERTAFAQARGNDDSPTASPINREGAMLTPAREEWVDLGRDRQTERLILDAIREALATQRPPNQQPPGTLPAGRTL